MSKLLLVVTLAAASPVMAADVSGRWTASSGGVGISLTLMQSGQNVRGWMVTSGDPREAPLEKATLRDDGLTFEIHDSHDRVVKFRLNVADRTLSGETSMGDSASPVTFEPAPNLAPAPDRPSPTTAPVLLHKVEPEYTKEARAAKLQGTVILQVVIAADGKLSPETVKVAKSLGMGLDEKAVECVKQWRFRPATRNGAPVALAVTVEVNFRLPN